MEEYKILSFFMNNKLASAVLCFGSHICIQAARIRVKTIFYWLGLVKLDSISENSGPELIIFPLEISWNSTVDNEN